MYVWVAYLWEWTIFRREVIKCVIVVQDENSYWRYEGRRGEFNLRESPNADEKQKVIRDAYAHNQNGKILKNQQPNRKQCINLLKKCPRGTFVTN